MADRLVQGDSILLLKMISTHLKEVCTTGRVRGGQDIEKKRKNEIKGEKARQSEEIKEEKKSREEEYRRGEKIE